VVGIKPKGKVKIRWSSDFAYAVGLLASDGSLSKDGRHIDFTSKDIEQVKNFKRCLGLNNMVGEKKSGVAGGVSYRVQFGDVLLYKFLLGIGFMPAKSKIFGKLNIPAKYFFDFLRGSFDGDGSFYSYYDPRWRSSFMFYTIFISASRQHIEWLQGVLLGRLGVKGYITTDFKKSTLHLNYAKGDSWKVLKSMYYSKHAVCLSRKRRKVEKALSVIGKVLPD
jgi:hypothetical protein